MRFLKTIWAFALTFIEDTTDDSILPFGQLPLGHVNNPHYGPIHGHAEPCLNSPEHRECWTDGFDINTEYEKSWPDTGCTKEFNLVISNANFSGDGYNVSAMLINGTYPGPKIEADWGDTIRVTVHNNLTNNQGTAIHWHGVRQLQTFFQDGVPGVTQCPITPGDSMTYEFKATQYGTTWYHSHYSLQYADGIAGPLVINGPSSVNYDEDLGPLMITDWYHQDAFSLFRPFELEGGAPPGNPSMLVNGHWGGFRCQASDPNCVFQNGTYFNQTFVPGRRYKWRIINTSATTHYKLWFDLHNFTVISTDFVPIRHFDTSSLFVAIGQRYDIVIEANADLSITKNFGINMLPCEFRPPNNTAPPFQPGPRLGGIIRYDESNFCFPPNNLPEPGPMTCQIENMGNLNPVVEWNVPHITSDRNTNIAVAQFRVTNATNTTQEAPPIYRPGDFIWEMKEDSFQVNWSDPSLEHVLQNSALPHFYEPITVQGGDDDWYYFTIRNLAQTDDPNNGTAPPVGHPIHLHGHDFAILAQSNDTNFPESEWTYDNATRRDVAVLPTKGLLAIAFRTDNPGLWLMHCHIAWHASAGLALQVVERQPEIPALLSSASTYSQTAFDDQCAKWKAFASQPQEDSGI